MRRLGRVPKGAVCGTGGPKGRAGSRYRAEKAGSRHCAEKAGSRLCRGRRSRRGRTRSKPEGGLGLNTSGARHGSVDTKAQGDGDRCRGVKWRGQVGMSYCAGEQGASVLYQRRRCAEGRGTCEGPRSCGRNLLGSTAQSRLSIRSKVYPRHFCSAPLAVDQVVPAVELQMCSIYWGWDVTFPSLSVAESWQQGPERATTRTQLENTSCGVRRRL